MAGALSRHAWLAVIAAGACASQPELRPQAAEPPHPIAESPASRGTMEREAAKAHAAGSAAAAPIEFAQWDGDPVLYARQYARPEACEKGARALQSSSDDAAWTALKACVDKGNFTALRELLAGGWDDDLRQRPDALPLLFRVIASRGGNVSGDLVLLHQKKLGLFALSDALGRPDAFRGQLVVVRAEVTLPELATPWPAVRLVELQVGNELVDVEVSPAYQRTHRSASDYGGTRLSHRSESRYVMTRQRPQNVDMPSGREALGRTDRTDPFLAQEQVYLVLARFEGLSSFARQNASGEERLPVLHILEYMPPRALVSH